jgi:hypothetical protein
MQQRRDREPWVEKQAAVLIRDHGDGAYTQSRRMMREADDLSEIKYWSSVKDIVARRIRMGETSNSTATRIRAHLCETVGP